MKIETIGGALIAAVILLVSNLMSLFAQDAELTFAMIGQATWVSVIGGVLVAFLKDYQAVSTRQFISKLTNKEPK